MKPLFGTTPYVSKLTGGVERLPAALSLKGAKGSDVALAQLVSDVLEDDEALGERKVGGSAPKPLGGAGGESVRNSSAIQCHR